MVFYQHKLTNMRSIITGIFLFLLLSVQYASAQKGKWGAGVRLGDPTGISVKKYGAKNNLEFNIGRSYYLYSYKYNYERGFYGYGKFKDRNVYRYGYYGGTTAPIAIQLHFMKQKPIKDIKGMDWYIGVGPQFRNERIRYHYDYKEYYGPRDSDYRWRSAVETVNEIDLGIDGVIGLEYTFDDIPLSIAIDATLFMEIFNDPFLPWGQGGVAIRYNFK